MYSYSINAQRSIFFIVVCLFSSINAGLAKSRTYLSTCKQSDPQFNECVKNEASAAGVYLAKGVPELNIPAIEPLIIPKISLEQGTQAINYKATLTNLKIHGLSSYRIDDLFINMETKKLDAKITFPVLYLESDYDIKGRALVVPIQGTGPFTANLTDVKADAHMKGKLFKRKGLEYVEVKDTAVKLTVKGAFAHFGNLFNGDPTLSRATNEFLNQNSKDIIDEVMPAIEEVTSTLLDDICNKAFKATPWDKLTPK
ncbi:protein takeout-like [Planococcus citri]|uniref:protein takeout-like n=1 Tax=Planococcus citri TaxID=170843 RepID=UPI0031F81489